MTPRKLKLFYFLTFCLVILFIEVIGYALVFWKFDMWPYTLGRISLHNEVTQYEEDHPFLPYFPRKNGKEAHITYNSVGGRGPEPDNPKKRVRILTFGGSTTFGKPFLWKDTWPGKLQTLLGSDKYEVINAALNGSTSNDTLVNFAIRQSDLKPDYVIIYHGTNDLESSFSDNFRSDYAHRRKSIGVNPFPFFNKLPKIFNLSTIFLGARIYLIGHRGRLDYLYTRRTTYNWKDGPFGLDTFERNLTHMNSLSKGIGAETIVGTFLYYKPWAKQTQGQDFADGWERGIHLQNKIIRKLGQDLDKLHVVDLTKSIEPSLDYFVDFCHFTHKGNDYMASQFFDKIKELEKGKI
jgi:lysophospholipase L1-like esterase